MHEWALAESVLTTALEIAEKEKIKKIKEIRISIGELQQIEHDIFEFALKEMLTVQDKKIQNVHIRIETEKSNLRCKNCEHTWQFSDLKKGLNEDESEAIHFIPEVAFVHTRCPQCKSPDFEITSGRGVVLVSIKGEQ